MKISTPESVRPAEATLRIIRQIARAYRTADGGAPLPECLN